MVTRGGRNVWGTYAMLLSANAGVWLLALAVFARHPLLLGTAALAYAFGLRHAIDADHICAIDNVTRKLVQDGKRPIGVGLFFSLGHSTIVIVLTLAVVFASAAVKPALPSLQGIGGMVGTSLSAAFLFLIAVVNAYALRDVVHALRLRRRGEPFAEASLQTSLDRRGLLGRCFGPMLRLVSRSRDMYGIGLLFGFGFDTATEVALMGIAAIAAGKGTPVWAIMIFPALFAAGMSLLDTTDGILMTRVYGWAFVEPQRKLYYNLAVTSVSVVAAVLIGGIELAGLLNNV